MKRLIGVHLKDIVKDTKSEKSKSVKQAAPGRKDKEPVTKQTNAVIDASMYGRLDDIKDAAQKDPAALKGKDSDGWSAAHWASRCGYLELLSFIADRAPALLSAEANDGTTPAHLAASFGHSEILSLLGDLDPGSLMLKDQLGNTPAHDATRRNSMPAILVLIERCPSLIYVANAEGLRPIDLAEREEMRRFLKDAEKRSMVPAVQLQTLARDNRALAAHNAVLTLYARNTWQSGAARAAALGDAAAVLRVSPESPEYAVMQAEFSRTMSKARVTGLLRLEHRKRLDRFLDWRDDVRGRHGSRWNEAAMERWLFCAADPDRPGEFTVDEGGRLGAGVYLTREASYADDTAMRGPGGAKSVLIARAVVGSTVKGAPGLLEPPTIPGLSARYDSLVDYAEEPTVFVIPKEAALYAAFVVEYTV